MTPTKKPLRFQRFRRLTIFGWRWYWRCISGNNRIIFTSGEGMFNEGDAVEVIETVIAKVAAGEFLIERV